MSDSEVEDLSTGPGSDPFPEISRPRRRGVRVTSAAAIALGLIVSGGAVAGAATTSHASGGSSQPGIQSNRPPFGGTPPAAVGTGKSVGTGTFTVAAQDGTTVTVHVGSTTPYFDPGASPPPVADVKTGEHVAVFGTESSGTVPAPRVAIGTPPAGMGGPGGAGPGGPGGPGGWASGPPAAVGTVKSVGTGTFTVAAQDGTTVTVHVGSTTTYFDPGVSSPTVADVKTGEPVAVFGTESSGTVPAPRVPIGPPPAGMGGPGGAGPGGPGGPGGWASGPPAAVGTVKSVGTGAFIITAQDGTTVTVHVGSTTTYFDPGVSSPTLADVKAGEHVAVFGTESSGTVTAIRVAIGTPPSGLGGPGGAGGGRPGGPGGWASGPPRTTG